MPERFRRQWEKFAAIGPAVLLALIFLPQFVNFSLFAWPLRHATDAAYAFIRTVGSL